MRLVLDTNVLFAAFASPAGLCASLFESCLDDHQVFVSQHIIAELTRHLSGKTRLPPSAIDAALAALQDGTTLVNPVSVPAEACPDPDDLPILGTALAAKAQTLVTGDKDLLRLGKYADVEILSPRSFVDRYLTDPDPPSP